MRNKWFNFGLTNFITLLRVVGIFALIPIYKRYGGVAAFLLSGFCFITDCVDGLLARKLECSTFFGSIFDGVSDKFFLIINMLLLMSITPIAIVLIAFELGIACVQSLKYHYNLNVQSNKFGKAKMWVAGICISLCYLLVDQNFLNYLDDFGIKVEQTTLFVVVFVPLVVSEMITLGSYIMELWSERKVLTPDIINKKKRKEEVLRKEIKGLRMRDLLFKHDYYIKYKDCDNLKLVSNLVKKK